MSRTLPVLIFYACAYAGACMCCCVFVIFWGRSVNPLSKMGLVTDWKVGPDRSGALL